MTLSRRATTNWEYSLSFILDAAYNGIVAVDKDGYIVLMNEPARHLLNLRDDVVGKHIEEIIPETSLPAVLRTGVAELGQKTLLRDRICLSNLTPIIKRDEIVGAVAVFEDITLLQRLIEEMSSAKEMRIKLQTVIENAYEGIVIVDKAGTIQMCNEEFCNYLKVKRDILLSKNISEVFPEMAVQNVIKTGEQEFAGLKQIRDNDVVITCLPIFNGRDVTGAIGKIMFKHVYEMDSLVNKVNTLRSKLSYYRDQLERVYSAKYKIDNIIGKSQVVTQLKETIKKMAAGNSTVLLRGEPGTGKELFAHAMHFESQRKHKPFVKVNCAAVPDNMLEAELFGVHESSGIGPRRTGQIGKFELADQGTVYLDEIGDMSLNMQAKLFRVLQDKKIERIGDDRPIPVDVRIIVSTNRNLEDLVRQKLFREDLYCRLNVLSFYIPPVRERQEDIEPLLNAIVDKYNKEFGKRVIGISSEVYNILVKHSWPGNVREMEHVLERSFNVIEDQIIQPHHLPVYLRKITVPPLKVSEIVSLKTILDNAERNALIQALQRTGGNKVKAAKLLKISRAGLYQKLEKYDLLDD